MPTPQVDIIEIHISPNNLKKDTFQAHVTCRISGRQWTFNQVEDSFLGAHEWLSGAIFNLAQGVFPPDVPYEERAGLAPNGPV